MVAGIIALILSAMSFLWIFLASTRAKRITIPVEFWLLYMITVGLGAEVPKLVYLENNAVWLREYLYPCSNSLISVPIALAGLNCLVNAPRVVDGYRNSVIGKHIKRHENREKEIGNVRLLGTLVFVLSLLLVLVFVQNAVILYGWLSRQVNP